MLEDDVVAQDGQRQGRPGAAAAAHGGPARCDDGAGLVQGAHRVADAGGQEAGRTLGDHLRVDEHELGRTAVNLVGLDHAAASAPASP